MIMTIIILSSAKICFAEHSKYAPRSRESGGGQPGGEVPEDRSLVDNHLPLGVLLPQPRVAAGSLDTVGAQVMLMRQYE